MESTKKSQTEPNQTTVEEYNNIPVHYCKNCLSLKVIVFDEAVDYCDDCGSADIGIAQIEEVLELRNK